MTHEPQHHNDYPQDVTCHDIDGKTILLVGTAHISQQSADLVASIIEHEQPDRVCIELDEKRYTALSESKSWKNLDLKQIIRNKQLATLFVNLVLSAYQKKLGSQIGIAPGTELLTAARAAETFSIPVDLCDRDVRVTLRRAWRETGLWKKMYLLSTMVASLFDSTTIDEEKLCELRQKDVLSELMEELGQTFPDTKRVLIDERDIYMAEKIKSAEGSRIVAVVGAGHVAGISRRLHENNEERMAEINTIPPVSRKWKVAGWSIPLLIITSILLIGLKQGATEAGSNALYWILANGIPSSIGAIFALAHPATIFSAFAAAPITSLTPVIGAGYVCAFVQILTQPPVVREFEEVGQDISKFSGWWKNKLLRVFLVFFLTGLGSSIGTWVGGYRIVSNLFG
ncbi:TraB/GumN family protein [Desulfogranum japonicum]|uniref:TraB/GumN family protein n=1 Tax=Desulfogranum japonicum TaxID=231447 RepID=UPI000550C942|nr:TraB/GumN family protein [Desulfogranum japonicum]